MIVIKKIMKNKIKFLNCEVCVSTKNASFRWD
jgi:hypothetical protein